MTARMSSATLDREVEKVAQEYRRRLVRPRERNTAEEKSKDNSEHQKPAMDRYRGHRKDSKKTTENGGEEEEGKETEEVEGHLTQAEAESTMPVVRDNFFFRFFFFNVNNCCCMFTIFFLYYHPILS